MQFQTALILLALSIAFSPARGDTSPSLAKVVTCSNSKDTHQFATKDCQEAAKKIAKGNTHQAVCGTCALALFNNTAQYQFPSPVDPNKVILATEGILRSCQLQKHTKRGSSTSLLHRGPYVILNAGDGKTKC